MCWICNIRSFWKFPTKAIEVAYTWDRNEFKKRGKTMETLVIQREAQQSYHDPKIPAGGGNDAGFILTVELPAPGKIVDVSLVKTGPAAAWVHDCPNGGNCPPSLYPSPNAYYHNQPDQWQWNGWTNSGDQCTLIFTVTYEGKA